MRFSGSSEPASRVGPLGQFASFVVPARIAAKYEELSCLLRPLIRCGLMLSSTRKVGLAPGFAPLDAADAATSPDAESFFVGAALASGLALHAAAATANPAMSDMIERYDDIICISRCIMRSGTPNTLQRHRACHGVRDGLRTRACVVG